jgi:hypothetical protein
MPTEPFRLLIFVLTVNDNLYLPLEAIPIMKALTPNIIKTSNIFSLICVYNFYLVIISMYLGNLGNFQCPDETRVIASSLVLAAAEIKNMWSYTYVPHMPLCHNAELMTGTILYLLYFINIHNNIHFCLTFSGYSPHFMGFLTKTLPTNILQ